MDGIKDGKKLVVYYSWGNNTKAVAEYISQRLDADLLELKPKEAYPTDYNACVSKVGRDGKNFEPELSTAIPDLSSYDTIFAGSPCWWGTIANPLRTFLHQNDFSGKTIVPFMTHGFNIHGVVFDELHTQPNRKLFDVMTKGSGDARMQPLYFLITTAGNDTNTICYEVHQKTQGILDGRKVDPTFYPVIYGAKPDEDWTDPKVWKKANLSLYHGRH